MAKVEAEVENPLLPKEPQSSQQPYRSVHAPALKEYEQPPPYLVAPFRPNRVRSHITICCLFYHANLIILVVLLFLIAVGLILWPSPPEIQVIHVQLNHMNISKSKDTIVFLDTSMDVRVRIRNQDFVPHNYNVISIFIRCHGKRLGSTTRNATFVNARSMSCVDATIKLSGVQALQGRSSGRHDDVTKEGHIPLEIVAEVGSKFHFFSINVPVQGRISCSVDVDVATQTIASQNCYPE